MQWRMPRRLIRQDEGNGYHMNYLANQYCRSYVQVLANHSSAYDLDPVLLKCPASPMTVCMCGATITKFAICCVSFSHRHG